jgi:hypothetical protein
VKNKTKVISIVLFLSSFILILLVSCKKQKAEWKGTIEEVNGVTVVRNPKEPMYEENVFSLEEELIIGEREGHEEYMFSSVTSLAVNDDENIYAMDIRQKNIRVFDKNGKYLRTIGRKGQGPGEMEMPTRIQITSLNELMVYDVRTRSLSFFSLDGEFLRRTLLTKMLRPARLTMDSYGNFIGYFGFMEERFKEALIKFNSKQEKVFTFAKLDPHGYSLISRPKLLFDVTKENNIVWALSSKYEIQIINSGGELIRRIVKDYDPIEITEEDRRKIILRIYLRETMPPGQEAEFPKYFYPIDGLHVDDEDRIFVRTFKNMKDKNSYYYDVFDPEGHYIAKVPLKATRELPIIWKKNKLYTIEADDEGYQYIKRYKVTWRYKRISEK